MVSKDGSNVYNVTVRQILCHTEPLEPKVSDVEYQDDESFCDSIVDYTQEQFMLQSPNYPRKYQNGN